MNSVIYLLILLIIVPSIISASGDTIEEGIKKNLDENGCICVSADYGCERGRMAGNMRQTGWCNQRCCTYPKPGSQELRKCKCMNTSRCPPDYPEDNGDCPNLVECCPVLPKKEL